MSKNVTIKLDNEAVYARFTELTLRKHDMKRGKLGVELEKALSNHCNVLASFITQRDKLIKRHRKEIEQLDNQVSRGDNQVSRGDNQVIEEHNPLFE